MIRPSYGTYAGTEENLHDPSHPSSMRSVDVGASQAIVAGQVLAVRNHAYSLAQVGGSAGTFKLSVNGEETAAIAYNASAADVKAALEALAGLRAGDVETSGGALGTNPVAVTFAGRYAGIDPELEVSNNSTTGGAVTATDSTAGAAGQCFALSATATDGTQTPKFILAEDATTGADETLRVIAYETGSFNVNKIVRPATYPDAVLREELRAKGILLTEWVPA